MMFEADYVNLCTRLVAPRYTLYGSTVSVAAPLQSIGLLKHIKPYAKKGKKRSELNDSKSTV